MPSTPTPPSLTVRTRRSRPWPAAALLALGCVVLASCAGRSPTSGEPGVDTPPPAQSETSAIDAMDNVLAGPAGVSLDIYAYQTINGLGAMQGAATRGGLIYLFGDLYGGPDDAPNRGVIREYRLGMQNEGAVTAADRLPRLTFTGREIRLTADGLEVCGHPTGLTFHPRYGTFLGDTVNQVGTIFHIDWDRALAQGTLDGAILNITLDDAAINGTRPEFVEVGGAWYVATADYGAEGNQVRLMDPGLLATAERTTDPGVVVQTAPCGAYVQSLRHMDASDELMLVQNITAGRNYRLTPLPLASIAMGHDLSEMPSIDLRYPADTELEGFLPLAAWLGPDDVMLIDAFAVDNVHYGRLVRP